jgi:multicomponent Na+:H+ antiporter subunit B
MSTDPSEGGSEGARSPYVESPLIMTTVRVITPFIFTFGLFVMFHGADSSGGGFQGGVIVGTVVFMLGIAFGVESVQVWVGPKVLIALISLGVSAFLLIGVGSVVLGGGFLEYDVYDFYQSTKYGIELVELAIGLVVAGTATGLFFIIASGLGNSAGETQ